MRADDGLFERERQRLERNLQQLGGAPPASGQIFSHPITPHGMPAPVCNSMGSMGGGYSPMYASATPSMSPPVTMPEPAYPVAGMGIDGRPPAEAFATELQSFAAELGRLVPADASAAAMMSNARRVALEAQERAEARVEAAVGEASAARFEADEAADENEKLRQLVAEGVAERERLQAAVREAERRVVPQQHTPPPRPQQQQPPSPSKAAEEQEGKPLSPWAKFNSLQSKVDTLASELEKVAHERDVLRQQLQQQAGQVEQARAQVEQARAQALQQAQAAASSPPPQLLLFERDSLRRQLQQQAERHAAQQHAQEADGRRLWQALHERGGGAGGGGEAAQAAEAAAEAEDAAARRQQKQLLEQATAALDGEARRRQHAERVAHESTRRVAELEMRLAEATRLERSWRAQMEVQATRHAQELNGIRGRSVAGIVGYR